ncbi:hypothetical protein VTK56DRAFT_4842 [Thermocarpiscus australiensis]
MCNSLVNRDKPGLATIPPHRFPCSMVSFFALLSVPGWEFRSKLHETVLVLRNFEQAPERIVMARTEMRLPSLDNKPVVAPETIQSVDCVATNIARGPTCRICLISKPRSLFLDTNVPKVSRWPRLLPAAQDALSFFCRLDISTSILTFQDCTFHFPSQHRPGTGPFQLSIIAHSS